jgi:hypothetical protein
MLLSITISVIFTRAFLETANVCTKNVFNISNKKSWTHMIWVN